MLEIIQGDNIDILSSFSDESFRMIYTDPPFNTGNKQTRENLSLESIILYSISCSSSIALTLDKSPELNLILSFC